uniref:Uncharacterized protein n=1 Tax=Arundo donax TaxID=35708 RepID=A0A0A9F6C5_ARUDO
MIFIQYLGPGREDCSQNILDSVQIRTPPSVPQRVSFQFYPKSNYLKFDHV